MKLHSKTESLPPPRRHVHWARPAIAAFALMSASSALAAEFTYQYYRWEAVAMNNAGTALQLSEFAFYDADGNQLDLKDATNTTSQLGGDSPITVQVTGGGTRAPDHAEWAGKMVDGSLSTKVFAGSLFNTNSNINPETGNITDPYQDQWSTTHGASASTPLPNNYFYFNFSSPVTVAGYNFATGGDSASYPGRNPISWKLWAKNDLAGDWVLLDRRFNEPPLNQNGAWYPLNELQDAPPWAIASFGLAVSGDGTTPVIVPAGQPILLAWDATDAETGNDPDELSLNGVALDAFDDSWYSDGSPYELANPTPFEGLLTLEASASGYSPSEKSVFVRSVNPGSATYQYFRFNPIQTRSPGAGAQLTELKFYNDGQELNLWASNEGIVSPQETGSAGNNDNLINVIVTNPGGSNTAIAGEGAVRLVDNRATYLWSDGSTYTSKWLDWNTRPVVFQFETPQTIDSYRFVTANDATDRDPVRWLLEGSEDGVTWTIIDNVTSFNYPLPEARVVDTQAFPLPTLNEVDPFIELFALDAPVLIQGEPLTLSWSVRGNVESLALNGTALTENSGVLVLEPGDALYPTGSTTYTLSVETPVGNTYTSTATSSVISAPAITTIAYENFNNAGDELALLRQASIVDASATLPPLVTGTERLRVNPDSGSVAGDAWFRYRQPARDGFQTTFLTHMTKSAEGWGGDGLAFLLQNHPSGTGVSPATPETGMANALVIAFDTFPNSGQTPYNGTALKVFADGAQIAGVDVSTVQGIREFPIPQSGFRCFAGLASTDLEPYRISVIYESGLLDVYFDNVLVISDLEVDLDEIGAVNEEGAAYVGFSGRTGGWTQANDIVSWTFTSGEAVAPPTLLVRSDKDAVLNGESVTIRWEATSADSVSLTDGTTTWDVTGETSRVFTPTTETTYVVTVLGLDGSSISRSVTIGTVSSTIDTIAYANFNAAGEELALLGNAAIVSDTNLSPAGSRVRLTEDAGSQNGGVWFRRKQAVSGGFTTTFGMHLTTYGTTSADGFAFIISDSPDGTTALGTENGLSPNAISVKFDTWQNGGEASNATVALVTGQSAADGGLIHEVNLKNVEGLVFPDSTNKLAHHITEETASSSTPWDVEVTYAPGDLKVYLNSILVLEYALDLADYLGDENDGSAYVGFAGRTGGWTQNNDITSWYFTSGQPILTVSGSASQVEPGGTFTLSWTVSSEVASVYVDGQLVTGNSIVITVPTTPGTYTYVVEARDADGNVLDTKTYTIVVGSPVTGELALTSYSFDFAANTLTLSWSSESGASYRITASADLETWSEVQSGIAGTGSEITEEVNLDDYSGAKYFFRVEEVSGAAE